MLAHPLPPPVDEAPASYAGLELLTTAVLLLGADLAISYANPAAENLFEISRRQLVGQSAKTIFGDAIGLFQAIEKALSNGASYNEQELELGIAGKMRIHLACTVSVLDLVDAMLLLEFKHIDQQLKIARGERLLEQQQANRDLIRSLAHEIKNPLGGIRGAAQLLERELDRPPLIEYTQVIIGEADRLQTLVDRLLTPNRLPIYRRTNIHEILARVGTVVQAEFPRIEILSDFDISLPEFDGDPEQLTQAVFNVVRNAAQALERAIGTPQIRLTTRIARGVTMAKRRYRLALADNGPGVPEAIRDKIFFPLVSGREGGSGLGLTIAQTFVTQHNGAIECESVPGHTTFTILLPLEISRGSA